MRYPLENGGESHPSDVSNAVKFKRASEVFIGVQIEPVHPANEPRLGLFWFTAQDHNPSRFASFSRPFSRVCEIGGFKTLDEGHVDVWPTLQRLDQTLLPHEYEYFPRGRVNWRKEDDRWLLVLDPKLNRSPFITHIVTTWRIPRNRLLVLPDAHYRSIARVGPPQQGKGPE
jgi:hypothetical protein